MENESPRDFPDPERRARDFSGDRPAASEGSSGTYRSSSESSPKRPSPPPPTGEPVADAGLEKTRARASTEFRRKGGERRGDADRPRSESRRRCSGDRVSSPPAENS